MTVDVERAEELATHERMAWSARSVWNRRPAQDRRRAGDQHLAVAGRRRSLDGHQRRSNHRRAVVAAQAPLVTSIALDGQGRTVRNEGTHQQKGGI